jgi:hypothetical protein
MILEALSEGDPYAHRSDQPLRRCARHRPVCRCRSDQGEIKALVCSRGADDLVIGSVAADLSRARHDGLRMVMRLGAAALKLGACKSAGGSNAG